MDKRIRNRLANLGYATRILYPQVVCLGGPVASCDAQYDNLTMKMGYTKLTMLIFSEMMVLL